MATTKPRITVTLTPRQHEVLKVISDCGGQSMSSLLGELIEVSLPTFERMANTFQKLKEARTMERARMVEALDDAQAALEPIASAAVDQFDLFLGKIESAVGSGGPERSEDSTEPTALPTPATNRGVTPTPSKTSKATRPKASQAFSEKKFLKKKAG